ncbi:NUDIX hydrolase domain-like protein [Spinellus fusiger]|nr:NUDIX hydrolase domain-like protein [Spinellus fusiger]
MSITTEPIVRVGIGCFVTYQKDNVTRILVGKRDGSHGAGTWQLPGGHLEYNESFEDCIIREVFEETNLSIKDPRLIATINTPMPADNKHYVTLFMHSQVGYEESQHARVMEPEKLQGEWHWMTWEEVCHQKPLFYPFQLFVETATPHQLQAIGLECT